jgi:hypothetical protein
MKTMKAMAMALTAAVVLFAAESARAEGGGRGGGHWGGGYHGGYYGGGHHGGYYYGGWGGARFAVYPNVYIGPGAFWWGYGYPFAYYPYGYYAPPPVVVRSEPQVYVQQPPEPSEPLYWYYCREPQGYYPSVNECPSGWIQVAPQPAPPAE